MPRLTAPRSLAKDIANVGLASGLEAGDRLIVSRRVGGRPDVVTVEGAGLPVDPNTVVTALATDAAKAATLAGLNAQPDGAVGAARIGGNLAGGAAGAVTDDTVTEALLDTVSVMRFIPKAQRAAIRAGTSTYDCTSAFEAAQTAAKTIRIPEGRFLTHYFQVLSGRTFLGSGYGTYLYHPQDDANPTRNHIFGVGDFHPAAFAASPSISIHLDIYAVAAVAKGARSVTFSTPAQAGSTGFAVGKWCWVRTVEEHDNGIVGAGNVKYPNWAEKHKIKTINTTTGVMVFTKPIRRAMTNARVSPIDNKTDTVLGIPWQIAENVTIKNMRVGARSFLSPRTGVDGLVVEDIWCEDHLDLISLNAVSRGRLSRISGDWARRQIEVACYSDDVVIRDVEGDCSATAGAAAGISIHEQCDRVTVDGFRCVIPADNTDTALYGFDVSGPNIRLMNGLVSHLGIGAGSQVGFVRSNEFIGYGPEDIVLENVTLDAGTARANHLRVGIAASAEKVKNLRLRGVVGLGAVSTTRFAKWEHNDRCFVQDCTAPHLDEVNSTGQAPVGRPVLSGGSTFPGIYSGTGSPEGVQYAATGSLYMRSDASLVQSLNVKTGAYGLTGWLTALLNSGFIARGDADASPNAEGSWHQYFNTALTADRSCTLPTFSAAQGGIMWLVTKAVGSGAGQLLVKQPGGTTFVTIPAAVKGLAICVWNGSAWSCPGYITLT